uniref:Uncharacterized protein n=1 Tax=Anopheles maculatus TaxID=74869 RepID=A0A182SSZ5_9DIPT
EPDEIDTVVKAENSAEKLSIVNDNTPDRAETEPVPVKRKREATVPATTGLSPSRNNAGLSSNGVPSHVQNRIDRNGKLGATLAMSKQELSDEFYRSQKRLIDYEFSLYVRKEEEFINRMQESTRTMLEEGMDQFFTRLKEVLAGHQRVQQEEQIETYE